jgi:glycosyltransferase involved in cell wall biosynthesis
VRVCLIPSTFDAAGCYRLFFPGAYLSELGHDVQLPPYRHDARRGLDVFENVDRSLPAVDADVYVFQQPLSFDYLPVVWQLRELGKRIVCETDDDFRHLPGYHPARRDVTAEQIRVQEACYALADAFSVSTPSLAESYAEHSPVVLRNRLYWRMWSDVEPVYERETRRVRVGWMGDSTLASRHDLADAARRDRAVARERIPEVEFVAAGDQRVHDFLGVPYGQRVTTARVAFRNMDLAFTTATMDVGLVPLASNRFNEGKSALKGMEYAACGIPCVASPTSEYRLWVDDGENGLLAGKPGEWVAALDLLVGDAGLRRAMGRTARAKAELHTIEEHAGEWERFYGECVDAEPREPRPAAFGVSRERPGADGAGRASGGGGSVAGGAAGGAEPACDQFGIRLAPTAR